MLHYRDKLVKEFVKQKMFSFSFCLACFFLAHLVCIGAEKTKETDSPKTTKRFSVSFSSQESTDSLSPTSSKSFSSSNSSPIPEERTRVSVDSQSKKVDKKKEIKENDSAAPLQKKKRSSLVRSLSSYKIREKCIKSDQKTPSTIKEKELSLSEILTETTTVLQEPDKKKEIVEELLFTFVDERAVFVALIDLEGAAFQKLEGTYPPTFILSLRELILQRFHGRVENLKLRLAEYDKKIKSLSTSDLPPMEIPPPTSANYSELIYPLELSPLELEKTNNFLWSLSDVSQLASALYIRDAAAFQDIDPGDMLLDLIKKDNASKKAIMTLTKNYNATADLLAFQILAEQKEEERKTLITSITFLGRYLYMTHNYHGASQVNACFAKKSVSRLWEINPALDPLKLDSNWPTVKGALTPRGNYKSYREQLKQSQNDPAYLPDFAVIMHDLENSFGIFNEKPDQGLAAFAISLEPLLKLKMMPSLSYFYSLIEKKAQNPFLKLICGLSEINEDVLDELSLSTTNS